MTTEQIRTQLEKRYTHVTFVKTIQGLRNTSFTEWLVGENGNRIFVHNTWELDEILAQLDLLTLFAQMKIVPSRAKWNAFRQAVLQGLLPATEPAYKRNTTTKIHDLLKGAN